MRLSEWVLAAYFTYVTALTLILQVQPGVPLRTAVVNGFVLCIYTILLRFSENIVVRHLRNWIPLALMLLAYKEMGWLAPASHDHHLEQSWIIWDHLLLTRWRLRDAIESAGPLFPSVLELCYVLVYALPAFSMSMLYVYRKSRDAEYLLVTYLLGLFLSYVQFPFWPSEPPRLVFPGEDGQAIDTLLRQFNHWLLGGYGIHTSVFPSAHVSGAFAAAFALKHVFGEHPWLYRGVFSYATLVAIATVYGRYHFAVDAIAGVAVGAIAAALGRWLLTYRSAPTCSPRKSHTAHN
jgi:membrane-associated phospholipid phosphatase